jgi:hypothetical protein
MGIRQVVYDKQSVASDPSGGYFWRFLGVATHDQLREMLPCPEGDDGTLYGHCTALDASGRPVDPTPLPRTLLVPGPPTEGVGSSSVRIPTTESVLRVSVDGVTDEHPVVDGVATVTIEYEAARTFTVKVEEVTHYCPAFLVRVFE